MNLESLEATNAIRSTELNRVIIGRKKTLKVAQIKKVFANEQGLFAFKNIDLDLRRKHCMDTKRGH